MQEEPEKIIAFPRPPASETVELPKDVMLQLRQASFQTGIPEQELFNQCLDLFVAYYEAHGHIPFTVVEDAHQGEAN